MKFPVILLIVLTCQLAVVLSKPKTEETTAPSKETTTVATGKPGHEETTAASEETTKKAAEEEGLLSFRQAGGGLIPGLPSLPGGKEGSGAPDLGGLFGGLGNLMAPLTNMLGGLSKIPGMGGGSSAKDAPKSNGGLFDFTSLLFGPLQA